MKTSSFYNILLLEPPFASTFGKVDFQNRRFQTLDIYKMSKIENPKIVSANLFFVILENPL
jgi:hypothetical protein